MLALRDRSLIGIVCAIPISLAILSGAFAETNPLVQDFFSRIGNAVSSLAGKTGPNARAACVGFVRALLDVDSIARQAAGGAWKLMTPDQQAAFRAAVERRSARECATQNATNSGAPVILVGVRDGSGGDRLLATRFGQASGGGRTVVWRLPSGGTGQKVQATDVLVDGRSMALTLRDETSKALDRNDGSIDALIATIGH